MNILAVPYRLRNHTLRPVSKEPGNCLHTLPLVTPAVVTTAIPEHPVQLSLSMPTASTARRRGNRGTKPVLGQTSRLVTRTLPWVTPGLQPSITTDATTESLGGEVPKGLVPPVVAVGSACLPRAGLSQHVPKCEPEESKQPCASSAGRSPDVPEPVSTPWAS